MEQTITLVILTKDTPDRLEKCINAIREHTKTPYGILIINGGKKIRDFGIKAINTDSKSFSDDALIGYDHIATDFFIFMPDDMIVTDGWLDYAFEDYYKFFPDGYGCLSLNDDIMHGEKGVILLLRKSFIKNYLNNIFIYKEFKHFRNDVVLRERCEYIGKFRISERARVIHNHLDKGEMARAFPYDLAVYERLKESGEFFKGLKGANNDK